MIRLHLKLSEKQRNTQWRQLNKFVIRYRETRDLFGVEILINLMRLGLGDPGSRIVKSIEGELL